ncbi:hypothetical protein ACIRU5_28435 [Streptomyces misionensis]|uniref:hypothetical protein n=1 Tax=Streptomyces misionensis TaxID=67331 RepID=UPI00382185CC
MVQLTPDFFALPEPVVAAEPAPDLPAEAPGWALLAEPADELAVTEGLEEGEALSEPLPLQAVSDRPTATPATASIETLRTRIGFPLGSGPAPGERALRLSRQSRRDPGCVAIDAETFL